MIKIFLLSILFFIVAPFVLGVQAASIKFDKTTVSVANGGTFQIAVTINPGSDALNSVDAYISFDAAVIKATAVTTGSLFPTVSHDEATSGKVYIAGLVNDPASSISTTGTLATITFQALKDGSATLSVDCDSSKAVKNDINFSNVISCSENGTVAVTVGNGGSNSPTTAPPSQLPQSGVFENVLKSAVPGMVLLLLGSALKFLF